MAASNEYSLPRAPSLAGGKTATARPLARAWLCALCGEPAEVGRFVTLWRGGYAAVCRECEDTIARASGGK